MGDYIGDLTDILRASGCFIQGSNTTPMEDLVGNRSFQPVPDKHYSICGNFQFQLVPDQNDINFDDFGDHLYHINNPIVGGVEELKNSKYSTETSVNEGPTRVFSPKVGSTNILSGTLETFPNAKSPVINNTIKDSPIDVISTTNSSKTYFLENPWGLRVSSTWNSRINRKNSETKRVVCIRAPSPPANSSSREQIVPSDQWAWWKNGQKRITGSPYLRDYYRCGSSKACPARKQVERSRTYPNMLVITYTSDHNHSLPTQRNTFTGSTRFQPSKVERRPKNSTQSQNEAPVKKRTLDISTPSELNIPNEPTVKDKGDDLDVQNTLTGLTDTNALIDTMSGNQYWDDVLAELGEICHGNDPFTSFFDYGNDQLLQ